jgi:amino acid transporter
MDWLWFLIVFGLWLFFWVLNGVSIGEAMRYQAHHTWKRAQRKRNTLFKS